MMNNSLPLDIESARACGLKKWRDGFFWPVSYDNYARIETEIKKAFNGLIGGNIGNGMDELLLAGYKLFLEFSAFLYSLKVLKELDEVKIRPLCGSTSVNYKGITEDGVPLRRRLPVPSPPPKLNLAGRVKSRLGLARARMRLGGRAGGFLTGALDGRHYITDRSFLNGLIPEYILKELHGKIALRNSWQWYSGQNGTASGAGKEKIVRLADSVLEKIIPIASGHGLELTNRQIIYLRSISEEFLAATDRCLEAIKDYISRLRPANLLIGSGGNQLARMLSAAVRSNGGKVIGFKHGEPIYHMWDYNSWLDLAVADIFITHTEPSARALEKVFTAYPAPGGRDVHCRGMQTHAFFDLWRRESKKPLPGKIERVMIVAKGLQYDNKISQGIAFPELVQLDWELSIIDIMRKADCKVLYKCHPDGDLSAHAEGLFGTDVTVVLEPFAHVLDRADCFVFYHTMTTTLGEALCTNKPVIYIDGGWEPWMPETLVPFSKRCRVVPARFDDRNRLLIDEERFLEALALKPSRPDMEFASAYMFPMNAEV